jgi:hypothetical protein
MPADNDPLVEAYHVLGQLRNGVEASDKELHDLRDQAAKEHAALLKQQQEAEGMGDRAALERLAPLLEQVQQAWIVANEQLADEPEPDDQPQPQEEDDAAVAEDAAGDSGATGMPGAPTPEAGQGDSCNRDQEAGDDRGGGDPDRRDHGQGA